MTTQAEPRVLRLTLPGFVPDSRLSLNGRRRKSTLLNAKGHHMPKWLETKTLQDEAHDQLGKAMLLVPNNRQPQTMERAHVAFTFVYGSERRRDPDGLAGSYGTVTLVG